MSLNFYFAATARWQGFFKDAGIPGGPAGKLVPLFLIHVFLFLYFLEVKVALQHK